MELVEWRLTPSFKRIEGVVLYELGGYLTKGDTYKGEVLTHLFQHKHILLRTVEYNILVWLSEQRGSHVKVTELRRMP